MVITRAIYRAIAMPGASPPCDRASLKIYYPAEFSHSEEERNSGVVPASETGSPFPVVIMMPGINVGPESYRWLAEALGQRHIVTVTYTLVAEEMPGYISLTPGLSIPALAPDNYGKTPSATAIAPVIEELKALNQSGLLAGRLDLNRILLGGHSAGGSVALLNNRADWFPGVCAAFTYGAHSGAATVMGYPEDSFYPTPGELPVLLMGGTRDGCIANSASRYGDAEGSPTERVERTFSEALAGNKADCALALIEGANHFSFAHPVDDTTGRPFIDLPATAPDEDIRALLLALIVDFIDGYARGHADARNRLRERLETPVGLLARGAVRPGAGN